MKIFNEQKQYTSCKCMYVTTRQCIDEVLKNGEISCLFYIKIFITCKSLSYLLREQNFVSLPTVSH